MYQLHIAGENVRTISSFRSPAQILGGGITQDMAWDANQSKVYRLDRSGKVLSSFRFPKNLTGLGWDGSNLWIAYDFSEKASLRLIDIHGDILETHVSPLFEVNGLAWAEGFLWALGITSPGARPEIYKLKLPGN